MQESPQSHLPSVELEGYELSWQQRRLWDELGDGPGTRSWIVVSSPSMVKGDRLREALDGLMRDHEILRTTYVMMPGMRVPVQVVNVEGRANWNERTIAPDVVHTSIETWKSSQRDACGSSAPLEITLIHSSGLQDLICISLPALSADAKSLINIAEYLLNNSQDLPNPAEDGPIQYIDFCCWQKREDGVRDSNSNYSDATDIDAPAVALHNDGAPRELSRHQNPLVLKLDKEICAKVRFLAATHGALISTFYLACWQILLSRMSGMLSFRLGVVLDGRLEEDLRTAIGLFSFPQVTLANVEPSFRFVDLLKITHDLIMSQTPWASVSTLKRDEGGILFDASATRESSQMSADFEIEDLFVPAWGSDICLCIKSDQLLSLNYRSATFDRVNIQFISERLNALIRKVIEDPTVKLCELTCLGTSDERCLLEENRRRVIFSCEAAHHLITKTAHADPNYVAVKDDDRSLTYGELEAWACLLALTLQEAGVRMESPVALPATRSVEFVVAILGILKAGGTYVPMDEDLPLEALMAQLKAAEVRFALELSQSTKTSYNTASARHNLISIQLPVRPNKTTSCSVTNGGKYFPDSLAYVLFTSGTTGNPKAVGVSHGALANYISMAGERLKITPSLEIAHVSSLAADLGNTAIFGALCHGGTLHLPSRDEVTNPNRFAKFIQRHGIDVLKITPSHLRALGAGSSFDGVLPKKSLILGGEALDPAFVRKLLDSRPGLRVHNHYGPTETTIGVTIQDVEGDNLPAATSIPVGYPIEGAGILILDENLRPLPIGARGEIYVTGCPLARGYLGRPDLTAESFLPNPFGHGSRMYKTGDSGRRRLDGLIEYLGRRDDQVKYHGFRVELGAIRERLNSYPLVQDSIVRMIEDRKGNSRLLAYYISSSELEPRLLRQHLCTSLAEAIIPTVYVHLSRFPLTANGKVNMTALPLPNEDVSIVRPSHSGSQIKELLAEIWMDVLGVSNPAEDIDFFELGGHSLLATQLIFQVQKVFDANLTLSSFLQTPTLGGLARALTRHLEENSGEQIPLVRASRFPKMDLSFAQERLWFEYQMSPDSAAYNVPVAVRLEGPLMINVLERSFNHLIERHETLRTVFRWDERGPIQSITPAWELSIPLHDLRGMASSEQDEWISNWLSSTIRTPFVLEEGPLLKVEIARLSERVNVLLLLQHHIVSDAWSSGVFLQEIGAVYSALVKGDIVDLGPLPIQYVDYAIWQKQWLRGEILNRHLDYWQVALADEADCPRISPNTHGTQRRGAALPVRWNGFLVDSLRKLGRQEGTTIFMIVAAALTVVLAHELDATNVTIGADVANRHRSELERVIGFFVNIIALRFEVNKDQTFGEFLSHVRRRVLEANAHEEVPFERVVECLQPERVIGKTPLFQILLAMQNTPRHNVTLANLDIKPCPVEVDTPKFDITLFLNEGTQGFSGAWNFREDLFTKNLIEHLDRSVNTVLVAIAADSTLSIREIMTIIQQDGVQMNTTAIKDARLADLKNSSPKPIRVNSSDLVKRSFLPGCVDMQFPLVLEPSVSGVDLVDWATGSRAQLAADLLKYGAILFRGFQLDGVATFEAFAASQCSELFGEYGDLPRAGVGGQVYQSTPYPPDEAILFHNESSHQKRWPQKIFFFCVQPAEEGGATPIVDCRTIYSSLDEIDRARFEDKGLLYVRNYVEGLDVSWQTFFHTDDQRQVEEVCRASGVECAWKDDGNLETRQRRHAVLMHPITREPLFFNQIQLHHVSCLSPSVRASLQSLFGDHGLPRNVYYGDGEQIPDSLVQKILALYRANEASFMWEKGDVLMLDNMLVSHSRNPYRGTRRIVVAMGDMVESSPDSRQL